VQWIIRVGKLLASWRCSCSDWHRWWSEVLCTAERLSRRPVLSEECRHYMVDSKFSAQYHTKQLWSLSLCCRFFYSIV